MCQEVDNTLCCNYHPDYIDDLDPPDVGAKIRSGFGFEFNLLSSVGTMEMWSYGIWDSPLRTIN